MINTQSPPKKINVSFNGPLLPVDLAFIIKKMKQEFTWENGEMNSRILFKSPHRQIMVAILHDGTEIKSSQLNGSITIQIIEGRLKFHDRNGSLLLAKGQVLTLCENINYSLTTTEETVLLLTIVDITLQTAN